jgi:hypothetical protein
MVFLSSTFLDLEYERRFVINWLRARRFSVMAMEDVKGRGLYWREWSMNSARKCDIYLRLFDWRVGSTPLYMSFGTSFSQLEYDAADGRAAKVSYRLRRPFADWQVLVPDRSEHDAYLATLNVSESVGGSDTTRYAEGVLRTGTDVFKVAQLEAQLERDVKVSRRMLFVHRVKEWHRTYFDGLEAAGRMLFEDEHIVMHGERTPPSTSHRVLMIVLAALVITGLTHVVSAATAAVIAFAAASLCGVATLAWSPTFVCVGTKTVMARGAFGLRTVQHLKGAEGLIVPRWRLLDRLLGVGALTVRTPDGRRAFVPFISNAGSLACAAKKPPRPDLMPVAITEEEQAEARRRLITFLESPDEDE